VTRQDVRIATVYKPTPLGRSEIHAMDTIRWLRVSESLAELGFSVDMIVQTGDALGPPRPTLRYVPPSTVDWSSCHVVKTLYPTGFRTLLETGGEKHPCIIARVGAVVGPTDDTAGVYFFGEERRVLWETHQAVRQRARYVTVLTEPSRTLWQDQFGLHVPVLLVPTGVDRKIPPPGRNPFDGSTPKNAVYVGNIYTRHQRELNLRWQERLNALGARLLARGIRLHFVGAGRTDRLDPRVVTIVGPVAHEAVWDYQYFADVGIVLALGRRAARRGQQALLLPPGRPPGCERGARPEQPSHHGVGPRADRPLRRRGHHGGDDRGGHAPALGSAGRPGIRPGPSHLGSAGPGLRGYPDRRVRSEQRCSRSQGASGGSGRSEDPRERPRTRLARCAARR
jgi:hypothetical protein